ncbi:MAG: cysteine desulfurase [Burkholderiaceae bacterium]|nr:cysteine desulfurase [Burkholderiaceae bacterium]
MSAPIYLDHHSTTPVDPRVLDAMLPYFMHEYGNASNRTHVFGRTASAAVEQAREQVAAALGARYSEIFFTSGATESNAIALQGVARRAPGAHLVTSAIEHRSVLDAMRRLEGEGWRLTVLPVDRHGFVDPRDVAGALRADTVLVSIMAANNEIGTVEPLAAIGAAVRRSDALFHVDATQALGRLPLDVDEMSIDLLSVSAHKLHGPKGVGALYVRRRVPIDALAEGGGQERGLRPGTLNVPGIVGFAAACQLALQSRPENEEHIAALRDRLQQRLVEEIDGVTVNGPRQGRLAANLNVTIDGVEAEALLLGLPDLALSAGAACSTSQAKPSHVLEAIGAAHAAPAAVLRFGLGRGNTVDEIDRAARCVIDLVRRLRSTSTVSRIPGT